MMLVYARHVNALKVPHVLLIRFFFQNILQEHYLFVVNPVFHFKMVMEIISFPFIVSLKPSTSLQRTILVFYLLNPKPIPAFIG